MRQVDEWMHISAQSQWKVERNYVAYDMYTGICTIERELWATSVTKDDCKTPVHSICNMTDGSPCLK